MRAKDVIRTVGQVFAPRVFGAIDAIETATNKAHALKTAVGEILDSETEAEALAKIGSMKEIELALQETARNREDNQRLESDLFTKRTRPQIARDGFHAGTAACLLTVVLDAFGHGVNMELIAWVSGILFSPSLAYMGVRTVDKWKGRT